MPPSSASWKQGGALTRNCFGNRFNEQYRRNIDRFPGDFAFQLKPDEWAALRSQIATLNIDGSMRSQFATASKRNIRHLPVVFTEHGALMAANILNSPRAVAMSVYAKPIQFVEVRDTGCPVPPSQIPAGGIPAPGSSRWHVVFAHRKVCPLGPSFVRHGLPVWASPTRRPLLQLRGLRLAAGYYEPIRLPECQAALLVVAPPFLLGPRSSCGRDSPGLLGAVRLPPRASRS